MCSIHLSYVQIDVGYERQVAGGIPLLGQRWPATGKASIVTPPREWKGPEVGPEVTLTDCTCLVIVRFSQIFRQLS